MLKKSNDISNSVVLLVAALTLVPITGATAVQDSMWENVLTRETIHSEADGVMLRGVAYGNGIYVAVGVDGHPSGRAGVFASPDGRSWTGRGNPWVGTQLKGVKFLNGKFYIYGGWLDKDPQSATYGSYFERVWESANGVSWTVVFSQAGSSNVPDIRAVAYGNGIFVAGSTYKLFYSTDNFASWNEIPHTDGSPYMYYSDIAFGNGVFVATGHDVSSPRVYSSSDGIQWTRRDNGQLPADFVRFVNNRFIIGSGIHTSLDGITWTRGAGNAGFSIAHGNGSYIMPWYGGSGQGAIRHSTDPATDFTTLWQGGDPANLMGLYDAAAGPDGFAVVGTPGVYFGYAANLPGTPVSGSNCRGSFNAAGELHVPCVDVGGVIFDASLSLFTSPTDILFELTAAALGQNSQNDSCMGVYGLTTGILHLPCVDATLGQDLIPLRLDLVPTADSGPRGGGVLRLIGVEILTDSGGSSGGDGQCSLENISFARYGEMRTNGSQTYEDVRTLIGCDGQLHREEGNYRYYRWYLSGTEAYIQGGFHTPSGGGLYDVAIVGISSEDGQPYCSFAPTWQTSNPER